MTFAIKCYKSSQWKGNKLMSGCIDNLPNFSSLLFLFSLVIARVLALNCSEKRLEEIPRQPNNKDASRHILITRMEARTTLAKGGNQKDWASNLRNKTLMIVLDFDVI